MTNQQKSDDEFRKDFTDSVIYEELDIDTIPADLMSMFETGRKSHRPKDDFDDSTFDNMRIQD